MNNGEPIVFLGIVEHRASMSNGFHYTIGNLEMVIPNIPKHYPQMMKYLPEFEKALTELRNVVERN